MQIRAFAWAAWGLFVAALAGQTAARGADASLPASTGAALPALAASTTSLRSWTGFYVGAHVGGVAGTTNFSDPFGASIYGDRVPTPAFLVGTQFGYNWQLPHSRWVIGAQADLSFLDSSGSNTCLAFSVRVASANCQSQPNGLADITARLGWAYGPAQQSLLYIKGGAAFLHNEVTIQTNAAPNVGANGLGTGSSFFAPGWIAGVGVEHAITPAWSVVIDYSYVGLSARSVATPPGLTPSSPALLFVSTPAGVSRVSESFQQARLGLNYRIGQNPLSQWMPASSPAFVVKAPSRAASGWEVEAGARYFRSANRFQKDLGTTTDPAQANTLNSRLTYNTIGNSGELFGRIEAPQNIFIKGNIGAGGLANGRLNDEDWILGGIIPYSNTVSQPTNGRIRYGTIDAGYDFIRRGPYKLGAFAGYNYYKDNKSAFGCTQIGNPASDCATPIPGSVLVVTEDDTWQSLRLGFNGQLVIADRFKLEADVAYAPYVTFSGVDDHVLRSLISPESGSGRGVQLEGILSYAVTERISLGLGGRYWSMWTNNNAVTNFGGGGCPCPTEPAKTELYGGFLQGSYRFDPTVLF